MFTVSIFMQCQKVFESIGQAFKHKVVPNVFCMSLGYSLQTVLAEKITMYCTHRYPFLPHSLPVQTQHLTMS